MRTNEDRCNLSSHCKLAGTNKCLNTCDHFVSLYGLSGNGGRTSNTSLPLDYKLHTVEKNPIRSSQKENFRLIDAYVKTFDRFFDEKADNKIKNLYLWSTNPGTGKTSTAASVLNTWIVKYYLGCLKHNRQVVQTPALFLDVNEFQTNYNLATITKDESALEKIKSLIQKAQLVPFLVMDDVGLRSPTEAFRSYLHAIINHRTTNSLPTVFTSNLRIEEMENVFDGRLYDRIRDYCAVIHFEGTSHRGMRR